MVPMTFIWWIYHFWARFWPYFNFVDFRAYFGHFSLVIVMCNCTTQKSKIAGRYRHKPYKTYIFLVPLCDADKSLPETTKISKKIASDSLYCAGNIATLLFLKRKKTPHHDIITTTIAPPLIRKIHRRSNNEDRAKVMHPSVKPAGTACVQSTLNH